MKSEFADPKEEYVPVLVRVIVVSPQRIICGSDSPSGGNPGPTELTPGGLI